MSEQEAQINVKNITPCWAVYVNSDRTEGRGYKYPKFLCKKIATAKRLAKKACVQGSDGEVTPVTVFHYDGKLYGPIDDIQGPTKEDDQEEARLHEIALQKERYNQAVDNAKRLGLSDADLKVLQEKFSESEK